MSTHTRLALVATLVGILSAAPVRNAEAQKAPYRFEALGERPAAPGSTLPVRWLPALNDNGVAAFVIGNPTAHYGDTLHTGTPGAVTRVETQGVTVGGGVSINNFGRIGFIGYGPAPEDFPNVYAVTAGGPVVSITRGESFGSFDSDATGRLETAISDSGAVMALADQPQRFPSHVVIGDGTGPARVAYNTIPPIPTSSGVITLTSPRMSARGDWTALEVNSGPPAYAAVDSSRGQVSTFYLAFSGVGSSDVAGDGTVVFQGTPARGNRALFTFRANNNVPQEIAGSEALPAGTVAMNDVGDVALLGSQTLLLFRNGAVEPVLSAGDPLLGSTVSTIGFDPKGFNNSDQFALLVALADGRDVFVLASPVPEPGAVALLLAGAGAVLVRRRGGGVS